MLVSCFPFSYALPGKDIHRTGNNDVFHYHATWRTVDPTRSERETERRKHASQAIVSLISVWRVGLYG